MQNFINDGYTESAYLRPIDRLHGEVRFQFRPMLVEERALVFEKSGQVKQDDYERRSASLIVKKLVSWSLTVPDNGEDKPLPITAINFLRLKPAIYTRITAIVLGLDTSDADPLLEQSHKMQQTDDVYESALNATSVGVTREARDEKN